MAGDEPDALYCRHGRTSANPRSSHARSLYLREDLVFERIKAAFANDAEFPTDTTAIAERLRSNGVTITCTAKGCSVDTLNRHAANDTLIVTGLISDQAS